MQPSVPLPPCVGTCVGAKKRGHGCVRSLKLKPRERRRGGYKEPRLAALPKMQLYRTGVGGSRMGVGGPVVGLPQLLKDAELEAPGWGDGS